MVANRYSHIFACVSLILTGTTRTHAADPRTPGPYSVGVKTEVLVDEGRTCSVTGKKRTLVTEIWYPAAQISETLPVNTFEQFWINPTGVLMGKIAIGVFGGNFVEVNETFKNIAHRDARVREGKFPLLVFSHGNGGFRHQNTFQMEYLASHGYIVAACDHTGNAAVTILPDHPVIYSLQTIKKFTRWDDRPKDVSFLISRFEQLNGKDDHWLSKKLITGQCGVLGHSFGGFTACRVAELDERIKAILPITVAGTFYDLKQSTVPAALVEELNSIDSPNLPCKIPLMVILGDHDRTVGEKGNKLSMAYFERSVGPGYLLNFKDAGHFSFTEMRQVNPKFGDGIGIEEGKNGKVDFRFSDAAVDQRITNQYTAAFFDAFLKNNSASLDFLAANRYPDEMTYRRK